MSKHQDLPVYDDNGINLADPHDALGLKTSYITLLQRMALEKYVRVGTGRALDIGCGYGRMTNALSRLGYSMTGVEPSARIVAAAAKDYPQHNWCVGRLPDLPFEESTFDLVALFGVARVLHNLGVADVCRSIPRLVKPGGRLVVIDNLRRRNRRYIAGEMFDSMFARDGLRLVQRVPIRASRWPMIYLIRYGLIPARYFEFIARWEINRMARRTRVPRFSYQNVLFIYERT